MAYIKNNDLPLLPVFIEHRITFATVRTGADLYDLDSDAAGVNNASTNLSAITSAIINTINESGN
jgi:hypothetical protein